MRAYLGDVGHFFIVLSFVSSLVAAFAYFFQHRERTDSWLQFARLSFLIHSISVVAVVVTLFTIIHQRFYEYHYAWEHSSNVLPVHYMISCFWEGQEGSFLLWIFWHVLIGWVVVKQKNEWEAPVMLVFALVQAFLCSMILGVVVFGNKFGSSPFALLRDVMPDAPVFQKNPSFVPEDGTGLNPLLQNYWMVIHPPTLFLGFALTLVPFAYAFSGLFVNKFKEWVNHALPWMTVAMLVLGVGILMGGYWAYETLNFGGYWNWDPVENAVFVPWLVGVASIHVMIIFKNNGTALKAAFILCGVTFLLILYSTFLTRSGILGNASVHSFTDLGLSGQLLLYLLFFVIIFFLFFFLKSKKMKGAEKELDVYSKEFWIFLGTTVLCLSSFHVLFVTSIPVYNTIADNLGYRLNMAPPADAMEHYGKIQIWFAIAILLVSSTGQFFYWKKQDKTSLKTTFYYPLIFTAFLLIALILISQFANFSYQPSYLLMLIAVVYALVSNVFIVKSLTFEKAKLWGGAVTHTGVALMLFGILYSSGYSKVVSLNTSGLLYSKEFSDEMNRENVLLFRNAPTQMAEYNLEYLGPRSELRKSGKFINRDHIEIVDERDGIAIALKPILYKEQVIANEGDSLEITPENTYYEVKMTKNGEVFTLFPRAQVNPQMGFIASPDVKKFWTKDLYAHVSSVPDPAQPKEWSEAQEFKVAIGDTFFVNDYVAVLKKLERVNEVKSHGIELGPNDAAVKAHIAVMTKDGEKVIQPTYLIKDMMLAKIAEVIPELGAKITFTNIDTEKNQFTFSVQTSQKDWIILKASEKPLINFLWLGALVVCVGMSISIVRRWGKGKD